MYPLAWSPAPAAIGRDNIEKVSTNMRQLGWMETAVVCEELSCGL